MAAEQPMLRPDLTGDVSTEHGGADPLLTSLCAFNLLVTIVTGAIIGAGTERALLTVSYPNYARADGWRPNTVVPTLTFDQTARQALVPGVADNDLALVLQLADRVAEREGQRYCGWEGYDNDTVRDPITRNAGGAGT